MSPSKGLIVVCRVLLTLILASSIAQHHQDIEDTSETLDELLGGVQSLRRPRNREDTSSIWHEYEFGSGAGNREEVVVTNVSSRTHANIPETSDWQLLRAGNDYLVRAEGSALLFYEINLDDGLSVEPSINVTTEGRILLFRVFVDFTETEGRAGHPMAVLFVETAHGYFLFWYRISGHAILLYSRLSVQHEFQDMEVAREGNQNELLLLDNNSAHLGQSLILVYGFDYDHSNHSIDIWFCRRLYVPGTSDVQVCPTHGGSTVLAFRANESVVLYAARNEHANCKYEEFEVIEASEFANFICFESGNIEYLVIAGREARFFHFLENDELHDNGKVDLVFSGATRISWIRAVPLNTYRDESLLLAQLDNSTVIALAWQGSIFTQVPLPSQIMNDFDLSRVVAVPKVGFMRGNTLVRVDVILREVAHPAHGERDVILRMRVLLEVFQTKVENFP